MRNKFFALVLGVLLSTPCMLLAEEVEIQLFEVIGMISLPGDNPLDDSNQSSSDPPRPTDFRASIDGNVLSVSIENTAIPMANLRVTRQSTHATIVNHSFNSAALEQMPAVDSYVIEIETEGGALIGYFEVQ
ncbi:MAG: hypothetical protein IKP93_01145 [Paludibacteraceae bacterium]|nr:hypothetical protein [Paludibacteraceae bacterium]